MKSQKTEKIIEKVSLIFLGFVFFGIIASDISTVSFPYFGKVGVSFWYLGFISLSIFSLYAFTRLVSQTIEKKHFLTLFSLLFILSFTLIQTFQNTNISGETTQETGCILLQLQTKSDAGFHQSCFLGYPSRQYLISAVPSLLFGKSQITLNIGGSLYFFIGLVLFFHGFFKENSFTQKSDAIGSILIFSLLNFHYFNHFLFFSFEQSIFPLSLGLASIGLLLGFKNSHKTIYLFLLGLILYFAFSSYTPAIALAAIALFYMSLFFFKQGITKKQKFLLLLIFSSTITSFALTLSFRDDIRIFGESNSQSVFLYQEFFRLFEHLFLKADLIPFMTGLGAMILVAGISYPFFAKEYKYIPLSFWILATFIFAALSQGYSFYSLDFRVHRAIVVLPFVLFLFGTGLSKQKISLRLLKWLLVFTVIFGYGFTRQYLQRLPVQNHLRFIHWFQSNVVSHEESTLNFINDAGDDFLSLNDELAYFSPNLTTDFIPLQFHPEGCNFISKGFFIIAENDPCFSSITDSEKLVVNGAYQDSNFRNLFLFFQE